MDNQSVISDITDNVFDETNTTMSPTLVEDEAKNKMETELNKMNIDGLKEKCKELGIVGVSKMKKTEIIQSLLLEFSKLVTILKEKKLNELKNICKQCGVKGFNNYKKELLVSQILLSYANNVKFKLDEQSSLQEQITEPTPEPVVVETTISSNISQSMPISVKSMPLIPSKSLIEQLEKQKQEIEMKMKEEIERQQQEEQRILAEQEAKRIAEEEKKKEKEDAKKKKQSIPKNVRMIVWNHYIGEDIIKHKCLCCKKVSISNTNFEVGHVLSEKNGGSHEINNLRPICFACNHSMGSENMIDFVVKFGLYIG